MSENNNAPVRAGSNITRRDFMNATLIGSGAALLAGCGPDLSSGDTTAPVSRATAWNGPSGIGPYHGSNGTTWEVMEAGHRVRDGAQVDADRVRNSGEHYDLLIVGGGFTGLGALLEFAKERPDGTTLLLDNQHMIGGYAKANEFEVDGYRLTGPQASLNFVVPEKPGDQANDLWDELGLPRRYEFGAREDGDKSIVFSPSTSGPLYYGEQIATVGYHFAGHGMVNDIWRDDLARAPWSQATKTSLLAMRDYALAGGMSQDDPRELDKITFAEFAKAKFNATDEALLYISEGMMTTGSQISAYGTRVLPNLRRYAEGSDEARLAERFISYPGGNAVLIRAMLRSVMPEAFGSVKNNAAHFAPLDEKALDRRGSDRRIRLGATVIKVANLPGGGAEVIYEKAGEQHRVTADAVVLGIGSWVAKRVVSDLPKQHLNAFNQYHYAPILMINVALRNWHFLDKLGCSAARWFEGFGFYCNIRKPMLQDGGLPHPFHPDKPIVLTFYAPFSRPDLPLDQQGPTVRQEIYSTPFATYEKLVVDKLSELFGPAGFVAERDIAGIIVNRWGHAFVMPGPGFYFGDEGEVAPVDIVQEPVDRIFFGQTGLESWAGAVDQGRRAVRQALEPT